MLGTMDTGAWREEREAHAASAAAARLRAADLRADAALVDGDAAHALAAAQEADRMACATACAAAACAARARLLAALGASEAMLAGCALRRLQHEGAVERAQVHTYEHA